MYSLHVVFIAVGYEYCFHRNQTACDGIVVLKILTL
jgi:hypothetical protein